MERRLPKGPSGKVMADWVEESLIEAIANGYFTPGQKIDQHQIATELNVSRTPVREAIMRLEADGFVEIKPHYGAYIVTTTSKDIKDFFTVRSMVEIEVIRNVVANIPDDVIHELEQLNIESREKAEKGSFTEHFSFDDKFHSTLIDYSDNKFLRTMAESITTRTKQLQKFVRRHTKEQIIESTTEHQKMIVALKKRDPDLAAEAMRNHMQKSMDRILMYAHNDSE